MVGKSPHRKEGKALDSEHMTHGPWGRGAPAGSPSQKELYETDLEMKQRIPNPTHVEAEEQVGGSRPRVPSRVRDAIERRRAEEEP